MNVITSIEEPKVIRRVLNPLRYAVALLITTGGIMHGLGMMQVISQDLPFPVWAWPVFLAAAIGYPVCSALVLKNNPLGYYLLCLAPVIGGLLIGIGFVFPGSGFLVFIPGTYANEITLIGFVTLITEPVAVGFSVLLVYHRIWENE